MMEPTKPALQQRTVTFEHGVKGIEVAPRWWVRAGLLVGAAGTVLVAAAGLAFMLYSFLAADGSGDSLWLPLAVLGATIGVGLAPYLALRTSWEVTETHLFHPEGYWASRIHGRDSTHYPRDELAQVQVQQMQGVDVNEDFVSHWRHFTPVIRTTLPGRSGELRLHMYESAYLSKAQASAREIAAVLGVPFNPELWEKPPSN